MKGICSEAKEQLSNCMLSSDSDCDGSPVSRPMRNGRSAGQRARQVHSLAIRSTSAYDTLERPFRHDKQRGRWATSGDFYFACTSHAFGSIVFSEMPVHALLLGGWKYFLISYLLAIVFYGFPIFIIQTFLGQFSTSGSISAFRVSPIFKGIGYSILLLNLATLSYYCICASVPLVYAVSSLHSVIPWMSCNNTWNTPNCSTHNQYDENDEFQYPHATVEFFRSVIRSTTEEASALSISWPVLVGVLGIWLLVLGLLLKHVSFIGKVLRCICVLLFGFFVAIFAYMLINEQVSWQSLAEYLQPTVENSMAGIFGAVRSSILLASFVLGPGWGSVLTLSSYNSFRTDSERLAIWVSLTHVLLTVMALVCGQVALDHFELHVGMLHWHVEEEHYMQFQYLCFAYLFGSFTTLPNFWAFLFFTMVFLAELCALVIQMMSVLTALFDEFEQLRPRKKYVISALVLCLMATSIYFCTKQGFSHLNVLPNMALLTHIFISALLLLMSTWVYGRERFQSDLQFMLGKTISNFKIFLIRFFTPIFLLLCMLQVLFFLNRDQLHQALLWSSQSAIYVIALGYMVYKVCQTSGTWRQRLKQCFAPHDWHPVDADNRRFYEEIMGTSEMLVIDGTTVA